MILRRAYIHGAQPVHKVSTTINLKRNWLFAKKRRSHIDVKGPFALRIRVNPNGKLDGRAKGAVERSRDKMPPDTQAFDVNSSGRRKFQM